MFSTDIKEIKFEFYVISHAGKTDRIHEEKKILVSDRTLGLLTFANLSKLSAILHLHIFLPALAN